MQKYFYTERKKATVTKPKKRSSSVDNELNKRKPSDILGDGLSVALSIFYGIFIVSLAIVCISSQYIASVGPLDISEYYLNALYVVSILWFLCFGFSLKWGCNKKDAKTPIKSCFASNRWLKGVVGVFGFSITIKDTLEVIAVANITNPTCDHRVLYIMMPILHIPFVFSQVAFLFLFLKNHIQECRFLARFGIMHIMATNLSVWIVSVAKEATEALNYESANNMQFGNTTHGMQGFGSLFQGNCSCTHPYCKRVTQAEKFLYPFLIEFCLIATCLLYVSWSNVGQRSRDFGRIVQPHYRLFKAYKGPTLGALVLAATITVIIILGSTDDMQAQSYLRQHNNLHLYELFIVACELLNFIACLLGLYLQLKGKPIKSVVINLDIVLLFVCFIGPMLAGLFSILALSVGPASAKSPRWEISLVYPIIDIITTSVQILFIVHGIQKIGLLNEETRKPEQFYLEYSDDKVFQEDRSFTPVSNDQIGNHASASMEDRNSPALVEDRQHLENSTDEVAFTVVSGPSKRVGQTVNAVSKIRLPPPSRGPRRILRDTLMFLVLSNVSLWVFLSLDKIVFSTMTYQYEYYGHSIWTILTSITTPLAIFLRMHSAACLFQMWSYA